MVEQNAYVVYMPTGITLAHLGDQAANASDRASWANDVKFHHAVRALIISSGENKLIDGFNPQVVIPGHRNELTHDPGPYRLSYRDSYSRYAGYPFFLLMWGEATVL